MLLICCSYCAQKWLILLRNSAGRISPSLYNFPDAQLVKLFLSEIHEQTLTKLRQQLTQISQDEWMYKPIDQIIGF